MNNFLFLLLIAFTVSCIAPDEIGVSPDADVTILDRLIDSIPVQQDGYQLDKSVTLDGAKEKERMPFSSSIVQKDLKKLTDYSFSRLIKATNYNKTLLNSGWQYDRQAKEKNGPLSIKLRHDRDSSQVVEVLFEDKNILYESSNRIQLTFAMERLVSYKITGSRKLIGMNSSDYEIDVAIKSL